MVLFLAIPYQTSNTNLCSQSLDYLSIIHVPHELKERESLKESFKASQIQLWNYFKITAVPYQMII